MSQRNPADAADSSAASAPWSPGDPGDAPSPFADLATYAALPRIGALVVNPAGDRLVTSVAQLDAAGAHYVTSLWEVDPLGRRPARRLTRGTRGESAPAFTPAGDLLFLAQRSTDDDVPSALWSLPAGGGEPQCLVTRPGGLRAPVVSREADVVVLASPTLPSAVDAADDEARRTSRRDGAISGVLHTSAQVRYWDHDLGPDALRLVAANLSVLERRAGAPGQDSGTDAGLRDVTGHVGGSLGDEARWSLTPDGTTLVTDWAVEEPGGDARETVVAIDIATGERRTLADDTDHDHSSPLVSPEGSRVALIRARRATPGDPGDSHLLVVDLTTGQQRPLAPGWDRWPTPLCWTPDGAGLVVVADDGGRAPLFHVDLAGTVTRLTADDAAYGNASVSPDGEWVYALRSAVDSPPSPVRIPLDVTGGRPCAPQALLGPATALAAEVTPAQLPGSLTEVTAQADDGTPVRAWLALPDDASERSPAPLLLWIHGGPLNSWNAWSWRWNPWLAVARGYAVLLPDPALSTGYGVDFVRRGWGAWGRVPYTDLMAVTDAALGRDDVDASRTAALGGSFGGYMANWIAGHTDRFDAIVTHASLWALEQFATTTDFPAYWARTMTASAAQENSPHHHADRITTPLLVIHGDRDDRVPIGEALRLWTDLCSRSRVPGAGPHRFLYFPDENHWVLGPGNARLWYETVFAFLAQHVLRQDWVAPQALG